MGGRLTAVPDKFIIATPKPVEGKRCAYPVGGILSATQAEQVSLLAVPVMLLERAVSRQCKAGVSRFLTTH